ncbi:MAG: FkbM family methyltransferase [Chthoniobacterales bacterium]
MRWRYVLKMLARSRSVRFAMSAADARRSATLAKLRWHGRDVFYRPGTSDASIIYQHLVRSGAKAEYFLPPALAPQVIVDIGSNIGASILYFRELFPQAQIFGFEPHPETFEVLQRNVGGLERVSVFNFGVGTSDTTLSLPLVGGNFGGFGAKRATADGTTAQVACEFRHAGDALRKLGIARVDLLKIDCEGSELDVFRSLPAGTITGCKWIVGEMHDASAFEIFAMLAPHFDLDLRKRMFNDCFRFHACNRSHAAELKGGFDVGGLQI